MATSTLCLSPVYLKHLGYEVDCGVCRACRLKKRSEWSTRISHEMPHHGHMALFVTLTYNNANLPANGSLSKRDLQLFFKRFRIAAERSGRSVRMKYFACGEYGDTMTRRPHYHLVMMGLDMSYADMIYKTWGKCDTQAFVCELITDQRAVKYVAGYTAKKLGRYWTKRFLADHPGLQPPFQLSSLGIGRRYAESDDYMRKTGFLRINGKDTVPPRYYRKVLNLTASLYREHILEHQRKVFDVISKAYRGINFVVCASVDTVKSRCCYAGRVLTPEFFAMLKLSRIQCDDILREREKDWRLKIMFVPMAA